MTIINHARLRRFVTSVYPDKRVSKEFLVRLEQHVMMQVRRAMELPYNRHHKTIKDF